MRRKRHIYIVRPRTPQEPPKAQAMTDLLRGVDDTLDSMTSQSETAPKAAPAEAPATTCRYCSKTFDTFGPARFFQRGAHEKKEHHKEWLAAKAGVKPTAKKAAPKKPNVSRETSKVTVKSKRIPAADTIATNLSRVGRMVARTSVSNIPIGNALDFSSAATGAAVDTLVAGTIVDRLVIQKVAGVADKWEKVGGVLAFPVLVAVISRNPALFPVLESELREATLDVIIASIPSMQKKAAKERQAVDALSKLRAVDPRYAEAADPILLILQDIFGAPIQAGDGGEAE